MAVVYFTSNASTGAGSLAEAVANASSGDIIRPDETVFERGSIIEIALASSLNVDKNLTLDASPFRVRLDRGGSGTAVSLGGGYEVAFVGYDFTGAATSGNGGGLYAPSDATVTLRRCGFYGCSAAYGGGLCATGVSRVYDCVFVGCRATQYGGGINVARDAVLNGVTVAGCVAATGGGAMRVASGTCAIENSILAGSIAGAYNSTATGSVVDVASSQIGFAAPPPDDLTSDTWDANAWQNWDLRLLDDASANPSPYRDSGDVESMSQYDYQGNFRGRETNGAASCSPGAYETIQADLFWVGVDSTGAAVASPVWNAADGWAASRFATFSGNAAPPTTAVVFVDGSPTFTIDSFRVGSLIIGGGSSIGINNTSGTTLTLTSTTAKIGVGATFRSVSGTSRFQVSGSSAVWEFADYTYFPQQFYFSSAQGMKISPTSQFATVIAYAKLYANGIYNNYNWQISGTATVEDGANGANNLYITFQNLNARISAIGSPRVSANAIKWTIPTGATSDYTALADSSTPIVFAPRNSLVVVGTGSTNDFIVDVTNAQTSGTLALTLAGQKVYGDAPTCAIALTGSATVDERGLTSQTLTLNADAELNIDDGFVCVGELDAVDGVNVAFSSERGDAVLTATESATIGAALFSGTGYFATPPGTDTSSVSFTETVRDCDYGANVSSFSASPNTTTAALLSWVKQNLTPSVLIEEANGSVWNVVNNRATGDSLFVDISAPKTFRLFDGEKFFTASARPYGTAYELAEEQTIGYLKTLISTGYLN